MFDVQDLENKGEPKNNNKIGSILTTQIQPQLILCCGAFLP